VSLPFHRSKVYKARETHITILYISVLWLTKFLGTIIQAAHPSLLWAVAQQCPQCSVKGIQTLAGCLTVPVREIDHQKLFVVHVLDEFAIFYNVYIIFYFKSFDWPSVLSVFSFACKLGKHVSEPVPSGTCGRKSCRKATQPASWSLAIRWINMDEKTSNIFQHVDTRCVLLNYSFVLLSVVDVVPI